MRDYEAQGTFSKKILIESFESAMRKEGFEKNIIEDYLQRGREKIEALYLEITGKKYEKLQLEYNFSHDG